MQRVIPNPTVTGVQSRCPTPAAAIGVAESRFVAPRRVSPLAVWRQAIATFSTHGGPILVSAVIGFAVVSAVAQAYRLLPGERLDLHPGPFFLWVALGVPLNTLAQGAIAWIGLHGVGPHAVVSLTEAVRAALSRWPVLLTGSLLHTGLTFLCALGLTPLLLSSDLWVARPEPVYPNPSHVPHLVASRSIDTAVLGPLHPFAELVAPARNSLEQYTRQLYESSLSDTGLARLGSSLSGAAEQNLAYRRLARLNARDGSTALQQLAALPSGVSVLVSLVLLIATETLLRLRVAAAMHAGQPLRAVVYSLVHPLTESAQLGWRHIWPAMASTWLLRLAVVAIQIAGLLLPFAVADNVVLPQVSRMVVMPWLGLPCRLACVVGGAIVNAILTALCTLYDAHLFVAIQVKVHNRL
jgi:hypothetical protein